MNFKFFFKEALFPLFSLCLLASSLSADQVDELVRVSKESADVNEILAAFRLLGEIGDDRAVPLLSEHVRHEDPRVRFTSIKSLGVLGSESARSVLSDLVAGAQGDIRQGALVALAMTKDDRAFSMAESALSSEEWADRWYAALALDILGDRGAAPLLEKALTDPYQLPDGGRFPVREAAQAALDRQRSSIHWVYALSDGLELARLTGKPLFIYFYINDGEWGEQFEQESFSSEEVLGLLEQFAAVRVNAYVDRSVSEQFSISGTPTILLLDRDGKEVIRIQGYVTTKELSEHLIEFLAAEKQEDGLLSSWLRAQSLVEQSNFRDAIPLLESVLAGDPPLDNEKKELVTFMLGLSYGKAGQFEQSQAVFERFLTDYPASSWMDKALYCAALSKLHVKQYALAEEHLTDLIARFPDSSVVPQAQELLSRIAKIT